MPKAQNLLIVYTKRIQIHIVSPGEHSILAQLAEKAMSFKEVQLREGRGPITNQAQFIRAVADNMKQTLFTTVSNRAQASFVATRREMYRNIVSQIAILNPHNWVHENPGFGEDEVKVYVRPFISTTDKFILVLLNTRQVVEEAFRINSTNWL